MLDLLAAIQSADPPSLILWSLLVFAAGMYPIGFMLGATCSPCCNPDLCSQCTTGTLPDTVTVTLSGWQDGAAQGPDLIAVTVSSDFGQGAAVRITAPGGTPGPISGAQVTSPGEGYARIARVAPTVTASAAGGSGASLSVTLSQTTDNQWQADGRAVWQVESVAVLAGGTGYTDGQAVTFTAGAGSTVLAGASGIVRTNRAQPTVIAVIGSGTGSGATLGVTLTQTTNWNGDAVWSVSALTITAAGSDYQVGDQISTIVTDGVQPMWDGFHAEVTAVDGSGAVTAVTIYYGGEYYKEGSSVQSVTMYNGGAYYKEDATAPAEVATVSFLIQQAGPQHAAASGASLAAVIDTTPGSTFGQITGVSITNGGTGYVAWQTYNVDCCEDYYNGLTLVLKRNTGFSNADNPPECQYYHRICGTKATADSQVQEPSETAGVYVKYRGPSVPPVVEVVSSTDLPCGAVMTSATNISNCDEFSFTATDANGRTAVVSAGGEYDAQYKSGSWVSCFRCCRGEDEAPLEVQVDVWPTSVFGEDGEKTTIFLVRNGGGASGFPTPPWLHLASSGRWATPSAAFVAGAPSVSLWIEPCRNIDNTPPVKWCDDCWDQCQVRAALNRNAGQSLAPTLWFYNAMCEACSPGPTCAPEAGVIAMDEVHAPSGASDGNIRWNIEVV